MTLFPSSSITIFTLLVAAAAISSSSSNAFQTPLRVVTPLRQPAFASRSTQLNSLADVDAFWQTNPYTAAALICGFKATAADIVAQVQEFSNKNDSTEKEQPASTTERMSFTQSTPESTEDTPSFSFWPLLSTDTDLDVKRTAAFLAYGALYQGLTQEFVYNHLYPLWFGTDTGLETVLTKVAFTLLVLTTVLTLPSLYAAKALMEGFSWQQALEQYVYDIQHQQLLQKFYILWGPVLCLTFSVIPEHYRVTFIALVSFFWLIILSGISSGSDRDSSSGITTAVKD